jgi:hypothetical protein
MVDQVALPLRVCWGLGMAAVTFLIGKAIGVSTGV